MIQFVNLGVAGWLRVHPAVVEGKRLGTGIHGHGHGSLGKQGLHKNLFSTLHLHILCLQQNFSASANRVADERGGGQIDPRTSFEGLAPKMASLVEREVRQRNVIQFRSGRWGGGGNYLPKPGTRGDV